MSPIGRAFIVVNLFLAGGFVFFAGSYHQVQQSNKEILAQKEKDWNAEKTTFTTQITSLTNQKNELDSQNTALSGQKDTQKAEIASLDAQIKQKEELLSQLSASIQSLESSAAAMSTQIKNSTDRAGQAYEDAVAAQKAADEARSELTRAQGEIQDKERMIADLTRTKDENEAMIADLNQEVRDRETLLSIVRIKAPGLLGDTTPPMDGTVTEAAGDLVTIKVANNPSSAGAEKFRGGRVAIYDNAGYKGDVSVTDASTSGESLYLFGRIFVKKDGASVRAGDRATTNTN